MSEEEKRLLLIDLCGRLPYGICVHTWYNKPLDIGCTGVDIYTNIITLDLPKDDDAMVYIDNVKPYLRPMSSMTEEEANEWAKASNMKFDMEDGFFDAYDAHLSVDWLNKNHFDYRGLIPMGLALEAKEGMYNK